MRLSNYMALLIVLLAASAVGLLVSKNALASDWVDGDTTEFHLPRSNPNDEQYRVPPNSTDASGYPGIPPASRPDYPRQPSFEDQRRATAQPPRVPSSRPNSSTDMPNGPVSSVSDPGGPVLNKNGQASHLTIPLHATIEKRGAYRRKSRMPGLDGFAVNILNNAPFLRRPKTESVSPKTFKLWLKNTHPDLAGKLKKTGTIEVKGKWDDSGHVMRSFGIPYTRVSARKLADTNLEGVNIVVVNCAGDLPNEAILNIRRFVGMGGFLITTDWALAGVLQKAFPGYVEWNGGYTQASVVDAVAVDPDPELFKATPRVAFWKLDKKSQTVKILRPGPVRVLARSRLLMRQDPSNLGVLAFTLDYGRGRILHLVGHFDNNSDLAFTNALKDPAPGIGISFRQALAANFLIRATRENSRPLADKPETEKVEKVSVIP